MRTSSLIWFVLVTVFQILAEGVVVIFAEAGAAEQAEDESEEEAALDACVTKPKPRAPVHMHDRRAVRTSARAGSPLQR